MAPVITKASIYQNNKLNYLIQVDFEYYMNTKSCRKQTRLTPYYFSCGLTRGISVQDCTIRVNR